MELNRGNRYEVVLEHVVNPPNRRIRIRYISELTQDVILLYRAEDQIPPPDPLAN